MKQLKSRSPSDGASSEPASFDLLQHYAPAYNRHGYQIMDNKQKCKKGDVLLEGVKTLGRNERRNYTLSELQNDHKALNIPHPSFDLNGDGVVSIHELAIAQRFDKDKDGILNAEERKNCLNALKNGFENKLGWNKNKLGTKLGQAQAVKCTKMIPNNNSELAPNSPSERNGNNCENFDNQEDKSRMMSMDNKSICEHTRKLIEKKYMSPMIFDNKRVHSRRYSQYEASETQKFENKKLEFNDSCNNKLNKAINKEIPKFVPKENILSSIDRLNNRENAIYRERESPPATRRTYHSLKKDRKTQMIKELEKLGNGIRPGIHKVNIPFKNILRRSKKIVENTTPKESENSHKRLWENRKFINLSHDPNIDQLEYEPPKDIFKDFRSFIKPDNHIASKITEKMQEKGLKYSFDQRNNVTLGGRKTNPGRFASNQLSFRTKNDERIFNQYPEIPPSEKDFEPVPSSFISFADKSQKGNHSTIFDLRSKFTVDKTSQNDRHNKSVSFRQDTVIRYNRFNSLKENLRYKRSSKAGKNASLPVSPARSPRGTLDLTMNSDTKVSFADATSYGVRSSGFS
ncbi:unnamed protein product [Moneuplotes crassus]|uniref:EF-hand domain-containing protein n=1 Tax=Euplotes crassus TaxID=5936 RepID=A0AAD1X964_EUPCR|nr:unnamed protein product [Moneuplotes crassus]